MNQFFTDQYVVSAGPGARAVATAGKAPNLKVFVNASTKSYVGSDQGRQILPVEPASIRVCLHPLPGPPETAVDASIVKVLKSLTPPYGLETVFPRFHRSDSAESGSILPQEKTETAPINIF